MVDNDPKNKSDSLLSQEKNLKKPSIETKSKIDNILSFKEIDLDKLEPDEVLGELFEKINPLSIPAVIIGIILLILSYMSFLNGFLIAKIVIGFIGGLSFVFGCSELIIFGVKGIGKKLNWSEYFMGIIAAIGADSSDVVVVSILLVKAKRLAETGTSENIKLAHNLTSISITLVLTSVLINMLILGVTIFIVARKKPYKLPKELSQTESNLVLAMTIFSFIFLVFGFTQTSLDIVQFDRAFEGIMGISLLVFYLVFIIFLIGDAKEKRTEKIGSQLFISEYFPEDENDIQDIKLEDNVLKKKRSLKSFIRRIFKKESANNEGEQFVALRRFPWYIIILAFIIGITGIIFGGTLISNSIVTAIDSYQLPILVYSVIIGFVSSAPEMTITFRALRDPAKENIQIGLVHQISSVNQTFFLLFGLPFLLAAILNVDVPAILDTTLVFSGIFALSLTLHLTIIDDNHFDRLEGALIFVASIVSILALAVIGGLLD
ncbi:MAG TPA: sodium/calcium exchanger protein [Candidatus Bathyarchaeia archaeon]|nr:sodium/calcium exchanger protein [Candidatus Bathyarchaeia archaeon]